MNYRYIIFILLFLMFHQGGLFGQNKNISEVEDAFKLIKERGEADISFELKDKNLIHTISKIISVTSVDNNMVFGNVNKKELFQFLKFNLDFKVIPPAFPTTIETSKSLGVLQDWQTYPTYEQYDSLMKKFAADYPEICRVDTIGHSEEGRKILFIKISDNVNEKEDEPEFLFSSTMHGNETGGYVLMLRYIDYLLNNYGSDALVTSLVDEIEIWINPLANPDGTYAGGNHTIYGATRRNANGVDLNRNFPDPADGPHPDGNDYQAETIVMMDFMEKHNFILSANFHSGAEVMNYPWDTWSRRHPDDELFQFISHEYADTVQAHSTGYMTGFNDGITNGWDWYSIAGGRQDYVTYFLYGREVTIELDDYFITPVERLENLWNYNYHSFLNYTKQCLFGIRGTVTDSITGNPLRVKIEVPDHDQDSSHVYSDTTGGNYYRLIHEGTYNLKFSAPDYYEKQIDSVIVENRKVTELDVQLVPLNHESTPSSEKNILTYRFAEQTSAATINNLNHKVDIEVEYGTDVTALVATFTFSDLSTIAIGATTQVSGVTANDFTNPVTYTVTAEDSTTQDWVVTVTIAGVTIISDFPYFENFESGSGDWVTRGVNSSWQYGTPTGTTINSASSVSSAWVTNLTGDHNADEISYVIGPAFNFSNVPYPQIELKVWWDVEGFYDGASLQVKIGNGDWRTLGRYIGDERWYNVSYIYSMQKSFNLQQDEACGWSGDGEWGYGSNGWFSAYYALTQLGNLPVVRFRVVFTSNNEYQNDGFAFDDIRISNNPAGIEEGKEWLSDIRVYPNPNTGRFYLTGRFPDKESLTVSVINMQGQVVFEKQIKFMGTLREELDLSYLSKGIYFIRLITDRRIIDKKIIKL